MNTDEEWQSFCGVLGNPDWTKEARFATLESRQENLEELDKLVKEWTVTLTDDEIMKTLQEAGVGAGRVGDPRDQMDNDPQLLFREFYQEREHPELGKYRPPRQPCVLSKTPCEIKRAPLIGEHSQYALEEILGLGDEEIQELVMAEVIQ